MATQKNLVKNFFPTFFDTLFFEIVGEGQETLPYRCAQSLLLEEKVARSAG